VRTMTERQKHHWEGYGYDASQCRYCKIDAYDPLLVALNYTEYCDEIPETYEARKILLDQINQRKLDTLNIALDHARSVLTNDQWKTIGINHPYRVRDYL